MNPKLMVPTDPFLLTWNKIWELIAWQATYAEE